MIGGIGDRATFAELRRSGRRVRRGPITVTFALDPSAGHLRVAFAIGRRVGNSVQRNRLRRRLRAIVSELGPVLAPGAYMVGAGPEAAALTFQELRAIVSVALRETTAERVR